MNYVNNSTLIRRDLIVRIAKLFFKDRLKEEIDRIPVDMFPKKSKSIRCCIYKDRAIIKYRLMALLGHRIEDEADELIPLSEYAKSALEREKTESPILTVLDEACSACVKSNYFVTNACRGCVARPCMLNCRKGAIDMVDGHAQINEEKCVNCGICMQECPYHAIIRVPVPCEEACPVNAITKDEYGREQIDYDKCIFCGKCMRECPFGAIMERSQVIDILASLKSDKKVIAMVAPAIAGQFSTDLQKIITAIKKLGFDLVVEVAHGADKTAQIETNEFIERMNEGKPFMTTSCCTAFTQAVEKHIPSLKPFVSDTATPMHYTAECVENEHPDAVKVFIGPCVAKKKEAIENELIDYVLSIEELGSLFVAKGIDVTQCESESMDSEAQSLGRGFPVSGGVARAIRERIDGRVDLEEVLVDGISSKSLKTLKGYVKKGCPGNFVEVMACEGGCMAGPNVISNPKNANRQLNKLLESMEKE